MITLDVSSIGTHTHLSVLVISYSIIRLYCLQPVVLGIILTQGMSDFAFKGLNLLLMSWLTFNLLQKCATGIYG